jgi:hypothetical protein
VAVTHILARHRPRDSLKGTHSIAEQKFMHLLSKLARSRVEGSHGERELVELPRLQSLACILWSAGEIYLN